MAKAITSELTGEERRRLQPPAEARSAKRHEARRAWATSLAGRFGSVPELIDALALYLTRHNLPPQRYLWRADGAVVLAKIQRGWEAAFRTPKDLAANQEAVD